LSDHGQRYVAVVGASGASREEERIAEQVGRLLAASGAIVVTGGLGGVMAAACRGAKSAGGTTVGLLPGEDRSDANPWVDVAVPTGLGEARNALVARCAEGVIAVGGEFGTLSEIALALKLRRPVVGIGTWTIEKDFGPVDPIGRAHDAVEAVRLLFDLLEGPAR
jgi:uncharacterized protein (TIGR00725 family)